MAPIDEVALVQAALLRVAIASRDSPPSSHHLPLEEEAEVERNQNDGHLP
jgi:hypothetical protein